MRIGTNAVTEIRKFQISDKEPVRTILIETQVFSDEEIEVAMELTDIYLENPRQKDYDLYVAVGKYNDVIGYTCFGPTALTVGTYDLYWIAVKQSCHNLGIGKELLHYTEEKIKSQGGRLIIVETSSQPKYENTRKFYIRNGYTEASRILNYYNVGDDLVIYSRYVSQLGAN